MHSVHGVHKANARNVSVQTPSRAHTNLAHPQLAFRNALGVTRPKSVCLTIRPERSLAASEKSVRWLSVTPLVTLDHRPAAIRWAARGDHAEGWRGGGRSLRAKLCVPEPAGPTRWSVQYRSASDRCVIWLYNTTCATGAQHAYAAVAEVPVRTCSGGCLTPGGLAHSMSGHRAIP